MQTDEGERTDESTHTFADFHGDDGDEETEVTADHDAWGVDE